MEIDGGNIFKSVVTSIDKSTRGNPGEKNAKFYEETVYGNINKNDVTGIFGSFNSLPNKKQLKVGKITDIKKGKAFIQTVVDKEKVESFEINISKIDMNNDNKNIFFEVTDKRLISISGGIVQGMSGSPIIQNDKIIGAVSHVIVDNPVNGYAAPRGFPGPRALRPSDAASPEASAGSPSGAGLGGPVPSAPQARQLFPGGVSSGAVVVPRPPVRSRAPASSS